VSLDDQPGAWRSAHLFFAILAGSGVVAVWYFIPSVSRIIPANSAPPTPISTQQWSRLFGLSLFAFVTGFVVSEFGYTHAYSTFSTIGILVAVLLPRCREQ